MTNEVSFRHKKITTKLAESQGSVVWKVVVRRGVTMVTQQLCGTLHSGRRRHLINNSLMRPASGKSRLTQILSGEAPTRRSFTKEAALGMRPGLKMYKDKNRYYLVDRS